jgi:hypothetical protein
VCVCVCVCVYIFIGVWPAGKLSELRLSVSPRRFIETLVNSEPPLLSSHYLAIDVTLGMFSKPNMSFVALLENLMGILRIRNTV